MEGAGDWAMEFNGANCNVMHFGPGIASDIVRNVKDEVHLLPAVQSVRDLGVYFTSNFKSSVQTDRAVPAIAVQMPSTCRPAVDGNCW